MSDPAYPSSKVSRSSALAVDVERNARWDASNVDLIVDARPRRRPDIGGGMPSASLQVRRSRDHIPVPKPVDWTRPR
jgi:hypothetical protein